MLKFSQWVVNSEAWRSASVRVAVVLAGALAAGAVQAQTYINGSVGGQIAPGVYGRVDIGSGPPPALLYTQPVVISRPAVVVPHAAPVYMYVPPGHAKHWGKHCARYNACGQQVYFLREPPRKGHHGGPPQWRGDDRHAHGSRHDRGPSHRDGPRGHRHDRDHDDHRGHGRHNH